jgi:prepilin-type N-terminal cleavage/methylation domain-containing protein
VKQKAEGRRQKAEGRRQKAERGVTLMELLIAMTLMSLLSTGIVMSLRVGLSAMNKADSKLMANRRVASIERILEEEITSVMPVTADCQRLPEAPPARIAFFQGEAQSMRLASTYSLQQGARGIPMILEYQVIPGENGQGVRLVVNEHWYTGPRGAGLFCLGMGADPLTGAQAPQFPPIQIGAGSFVLADKLAYCRFSYRDLLPPPELERWLVHWIKPVLPSAVRVEMAPLVPDSSRLEPVTLTIPVRVTRLPLEPYDN